MSGSADSIAQLQSLVSVLTENVTALENQQHIMDPARAIQATDDIATFDDGDIAWMLTSTALVLFMTLFIHDVQHLHYWLPKLQLVVLRLLGC